MELYNTKSRKKEEFKPLKQDAVKVYYCGPTVYNHAHIGNLRTYVFCDVVVRSLRFLGFKVDTVMNITDVDDKTIRDSQAAGEKLSDFTEKYTKIFLEDTEKL
jgi:cysteinyl-tRNA synthetase